MAQPPVPVPVVPVVPAPTPVQLEFRLETGSGEWLERAMAFINREYKGVLQHSTALDGFAFMSKEPGTPALPYINLKKHLVKKDGRPGKLGTLAHTLMDVPPEVFGYPADAARHNAFLNAVQYAVGAPNGVVMESAGHRGVVMLNKEDAGGK